MTVIEQIIREAESLSVKEQRQALQAIKSLRSDVQAKRPRRKTLGAARKALGAAKGMWKGRADLPANTIEASNELRRRVMQRGHGDVECSAFSVV